MLGPFLGPFLFSNDLGLDYIIKRRTFSEVFIRLI